MKGTRSVFLVALKMLIFLGFKRVLLVGCDWHMTPEQPYGFAQSIPPNRVKSNNNLFIRTSHRLQRLKPYMDAAGFEVFNVTPGSFLRVFPDMDFDEAVNSVMLNPTIVTEGKY